MKLLDNIYTKLKVAFLPALVATGIILSVTSVYVYKKHLEAEAFLNEIDLQARNTSGASFFATKKKLFVGQNLTRNEVIQYLKSTNSVQRQNLGEPGSYVLQGDNILLITPRLPEFQPLTLTFRRDRITRIQVAPTPLNAVSGEVSEASIEPEPLGAFIISLNDEKPSKMFVRRYTVQFTDFNEADLFYAILASEDSSFMSHNGTRFERILINLVPGHKGGGSSITAQVIKNAVSLDRTLGVGRKIDEIFLASALEQRMSKQEILTLYVNNVFLGGGNGSPNIFGFQAAAEQYFGKRNIKDLTLSEACTLVAMLPRPNIFLKRSKEGDYLQLTKWRDRVLRRLNEIWPEKYPNAVIETAKHEEVRFISRAYEELPLDIICRGFINYATQQQPLIELENLPPTEYSGLRIYTSIDPDLMREAQRILSRYIPTIERRFPPLKNNCSGNDDRMLGAIIALNPKTGEIITMSGGAGGEEGVKYAQLAINATDAPASTIKPFWLVKALAEAILPNGERFTGGSVIDASNASFFGWQPRLGVRGTGRPRAQLAMSADDFAVYILNLVGVENGKRFYEQLTGNTITNLSGQLPLGFGSGTEISPLHLSRAYAIFGNNGALVELNPISQVYLDGKEVEYKRKAPVQVVDASAAYITAQMMRSVLGYGLDGATATARQPFAKTHLSINRVEMGGKTGSGPYSTWMISVSPNLISCVFLTYQCHSEIRNSEMMYSRDTAAMVWAEFIKSTQKFRPDLLSGSFNKPSNIIEVPIDPVRGCRSNGSNSIKEFFIQGTEPHPCER